MKIAVSGAHHVGKTTLIEAFVRAHPDYDFEAEPYYALAEAGVAFSDPPTVEDFLEQLAYSVRRIEERSGEAKVIFDRCPLDFIAYLRALAAHSGDDFGVEDFRDEVADALESLDLIVFIPADGEFGGGRTSPIRASGRRPTSASRRCSSRTSSRSSTAVSRLSWRSPARRNGGCASWSVFSGARAEDSYLPAVGRMSGASPLPSGERARVRG